MSWLELVMLICFGAAWPLSIYKSYKTKSTKGKSLTFLIVILVGYLAGIANKIINSFNWVIYAYILNAVMVAADIFLYFKNPKI